MASATGDAGNKGRMVVVDSNNGCRHRNVEFNKDNAMLLTISVPGKHRDRQEAACRDRKNDRNRDRQESGYGERRSDGIADREETGHGDRRSDRSRNRQEDGYRDRRSDGSRDRQEACYGKRRSDRSRDRQEACFGERRNDGIADRQEASYRDRRGDRSRDRQDAAYGDRRSDGSRDRQEAGYGDRSYGIADRQEAGYRDRRSDGSRDRQDADYRDGRGDRSRDREESGYGERRSDKSKDRQESGYGERRSYGIADRQEAGYRDRRSDGSRNRQDADYRDGRGDRSRNREESGYGERRSDRSRDRQESGYGERRSYGIADRQEAGYRDRRSDGSRDRQDAAYGERRSYGIADRQEACHRDIRRDGSRDRQEACYRRKDTRGERGSVNVSGYRRRVETTTLGNSGGARGQGGVIGNQRGLKRSFTESTNTDGPAEILSSLGIGNQRTGSRPINSNNSNNNRNKRRRKDIIDYERLESYIEREPDEIVMELVKVKASMIELLKTKLKPDWITLLMKLFALVTESSLKANVIDILYMLQGSRLTEYLKERIQMLSIDADEATSCSNIEDFVRNVVTVFEEFLRLFPTSHAELPIDSLILAMQEPNLQQGICESIRDRIQGLAQTRKGLLKDRIQQENASARNKPKYPTLSPPEDFRTLSIVPTPDDLDMEKRPFLRRIKKYGKYHNAEEYLDIQFRLLREDFVQPLREGIHEIVAEMQREDRKQNLKIYTNVRIICPICTPSGIVHRLRFDALRHSRGMKSGSLVCLSEDFNGALIFATVANSKFQNLERGEVEVRFIGGLAALANVEKDDVFQMVESPSFYPAYCHVLAAMQGISADQMPFKEYIVDGSCHVGTPKYLGSASRDYIYDLRGCLTNKYIKCDVKLSELHEYDGPIELNESQKVAVEKALTKDFVVIQGPPGTGKTYVGLKIAHALLQNSELWGKAGNAQMLVVCYTNHALDQFLMGLLTMGHTSMIRVGGRCQNQALKGYCLSEVIRRGDNCNRRTFREIGGARSAKKEARDERDRLGYMLKPAANVIEKVNYSVLNGEIVSFTSFLPVRIQSWFTNLDCICKDNHIGFWDVWLGICPMPVNLEQEIRRESSHLNENIAMGELMKSTRRTAAGEEDQDDHAEEEGHDDEIDIGRKAEELVLAWVIDNNIGASNVEKDLEPEGKFVNEVPTKAERAQRARRRLMQSQPMSENEVKAISAPWELDLEQRWSLYAYLIQKSLQVAQGVVDELGNLYEEACERVTELTRREEELHLRNSKIIAMTTTGAARLQDSLSRLRPSIVVVEEAAEVFEAHVLTALTTETQHVVLIGDHKQLKPKPSVYKLATKYKLELSLFERMLNNGMECYSLNTQHRMRPCIAYLLHDIYPQLENHPSVEHYPNILGVESNLYLINCDFMESGNDELKSKSNQREAEYIVALCSYLLMQGYDPGSITVLTLYTGQLMLLKKLMPEERFKWVKIAAVDNYQGEENDIILLSLVRNNDEGKLGFTSIENRICVSLSRAKHGLFAIGNFDFLAASSKYWRKIVKRAARMRCIGQSLTLLCRNHPKSIIEARQAEDFRQAPEGGCKLPCNYRFACGHACGKACHPVDEEHIEIRCYKICDKKLCDNGHVCKRQCHYGEECGPCKTKIAKIIPDCAHEQMMRCSVDAKDFQCILPFEKELTCGHKATVKCYVNEESVKCREQVEVDLQCGHLSRVACYMRNDTEDVECGKACEAQLECGHYCKGTCAKCHRGRLHMKCTSPCERLLPCSHLCKEPCSRECPPCTETCANFCGHSRCPKPCGEVCSPCIEKCMLSCEHQKCSKLCHEQCDRPLCNEPCSKQLKCGHKCIGLCKEKCPEVCRICDKAAVEEIFFGNEDEEDARFIQLVDCDHFFEVGGLDQWMKQENDDNNDASVSIKLKECPKCKTPIKISWRYGNVIKKCMQDVNEVKKEILNQRKALLAENHDQMLSLYNRISGSGDFALFGFAWLKHECSPKNRSGWKTINTNQVSFLEMAVNILEDIIDIVTRKDLNDTDKRIFNKALRDLDAACKLSLSNNISVQQMIDADLELNRYRLLLIACESKRYAMASNVETNSVCELFSECYDKITSGERIDKDSLNGYEKIIKDYREVHGLGEITRKEKKMIIKAMGLKAGHWYKCKNGHYYAIGQCGGAMEESTCPECKEVIGGKNHGLAAGNEHAGEFDGSKHAAWSNGANMNNFDLNELQ
eukprot:gene18595-20461_t